MRVLNPNELVKIAGYFTATPGMSDEDIKRTVRRNSRALRDALAGGAGAVTGAMLAGGLSKSKLLGAGLGLEAGVTLNELLLNRLATKSDERAAEDFLKEFRKKNGRFRKRNR